MSADPDVITELDVVDEYRTFVRCEECDEADVAVAMVRQCDGGWLCTHCDNGFRAEWEEQQRYLARIRFSG